VRVGTGPRRWLRHLWTGSLQVRSAFPREAMARIEAAIAAGERRHRAEVRFAVEGSLSAGELWRGVTARERAIEVFSQFRVWDTEEDNGVLVYLLWADHAVEIVADRAAARRIAQPVWQAACRKLTEGCASGQPLEGALACLEAIALALESAFPPDGSRPDTDELPNTPIVLG